MPMLWPRVSLSLLLGLFFWGPAALADEAPWEPPADADDGVPAKTSTDSVAQLDEPLGTQPLISAPIYISARGSIAVPANGNGDVLVGGLGMGILVAPQHAVGIRFIYMKDPPTNPLAARTPDVPWAWGPVLDWQVTFSPEARASIFLHTSLGYVYGTPENKAAKNVILPILDGGVGLRLAKRMRDGSQVFIAPELGFVPAAVAPFSAINMGIVLPGRGSR